MTSKKDQEKEVFGFTGLRVWSQIFPLVLDLETALKDKTENPKAQKCISNASSSLEHLVIGYYNFHLVEKYLAYNQAREQASVTLFLIYRLGFVGVIEKEKVLEFGQRLKEAIKMINSLIKNFENKVKRMDEAKVLLERIRG